MLQAELSPTEQCAAQLLTDTLFETLSQRLQSKLQQDVLDNPFSSSPDLLNGTVGIWFALYQLQKQRPWLVSEALLETTFEPIVTQSQRFWPDLSICYGLGGVGWLLEYLAADQGWAEDHTAAIAQLYAQRLGTERWQGELEYVVGLTGQAPFILRRALQQPAASNLAQQWLTQLAQCARRTKEGGLYWPTAANSVYRIIRHNPLYIEVNLGMAHGMTGGLNCLCKAAEVPLLRQQALAMACDAADYLLQQQLQPTEAEASLFPNLAGKPTHSRLGWCYGDLPIALGLARLAQLSGSVHYRTQAVQITKRCLARTARSGSIADGGLCHGAAGVWLMFYLLSVLLPELSYEPCMQYWQQWLWQHYQQQGAHSGEFGFPRYFADNYVACTGLLEGDAGVLLALLVMDGQPADWADVLLLC